MAKRTNLKIGDKLIACGREYELIQNIGVMRGFQFRTYLVKAAVGGKQYVAKITEDRNRALAELKVHIFLNAKKYPERYYAKTVAFDHEAAMVRRGTGLRKKFAVLVLTYLPSERFQPLDQYLNRESDKPMGKHVARKLCDKLKRRIDKLHELGISHGDLKTANIMVTVGDGGRTGVRLIDFGCSTFEDESRIEKDNRQLKKVLDRVASLH